jgi:hypothetical protein
VPKPERGPTAPLHFLGYVTLVGRGDPPALKGKKVNPRMDPQNLWPNRHADVTHWLNEIIYQLKLLLDQGHPPVITPNNFVSWHLRLRDTLDCTDWAAPALRTGELRGKHTAAIALIDDLVEDLTLIWEHHTPKRAITIARIEQIDRLDQQLDCRENPIKY